MGGIILEIIQVVFGIDVAGTIDTNYVSLAIFALIYGFFGAFVSLFLSKWMAKKFYRIELLTKETLFTRTPAEKIVYQTVEKIAREHNLTLPEIGVYNSPEVNAFATGATRNSSLVAVSSGLLHAMQPDEIEGVIGHEMTHVINGDMVTMTLLQ